MIYCVDLCNTAISKSIARSIYLAPDGRLLRSTLYVSNDVIAAEPVAETKKDNVRPYFCCQTTSAWNAVPAYLFRANVWSSTTPHEACGRRAIQRLRSGRAWKLMLDRVSPTPAKWWSRAPVIEIMKDIFASKNSGHDCTMLVGRTLDTARERGR
jgi:hypothetical protein